jgi:hypothetical protein
MCKGNTRCRNFVGSVEVRFVEGKFTVMNTNVAKVRSRAVEMIGNLRLKEYLWLNGNYADVLLQVRTRVPNEELREKFDE